MQGDTTFTSDVDRHQMWIVVDGSAPDRKAERLNASGGDAYFERGIWILQRSHLLASARHRDRPESTLPQPRYWLRGPEMQFALGLDPLASHVATAGADNQGATSG